MQDFEKQQGIAFFIIYYTNKDLIYYLTLRELMVYWERMEQGGRKSFRFDELSDEKISEAVSVFLPSSFLGVFFEEDCEPAFDVLPFAVTTLFEALLVSELITL